MIRLQAPFSLQLVRSAICQNLSPKLPILGSPGSGKDILAVDFSPFWGTLKIGSDKASLSDNCSPLTRRLSRPIFLSSNRTFLRRVPTPLGPIPLDFFPKVLYILLEVNISYGSRRIGRRYPSEDCLASFFVQIKQSSIPLKSSANRLTNGAGRHNMDVTELPDRNVGNQPDHLESGFLLFRRQNARFERNASHHG